MQVSVFSGCGNTLSVSFCENTVLSPISSHLSVGLEGICQSFSAWSVCLHYGKHVAHIHPKVKPSISNMFVNEHITNGNRKINLKSHRGFVLCVLLLCATFHIPYPQTHINIHSTYTFFLLECRISVLLNWRYYCNSVC